MNTLIGYDLVPEAKILDSALRACRRLNDLASAIRILEAVKVSDSLGSLNLVIRDRFGAWMLVDLQRSITVVQSRTVSYTEEPFLLYSFPALDQHFTSLKRELLQNSVHFIHKTIHFHFTV